ncbi:hypothetical protein H5410_016087 [Solanum commersonii]|uniref:DUF4283 domain-containing protein n=1 Tax=Solanum commersonii TaxID=4109 RepID=A0A9J5ZWJ8_SOLCO|nr:hypothetical protein H5410_016087 [Solanum commersonii]
MLAATASGQPPPEVGLPVVPNRPSYAASLGYPKAQIKPLPLKPISYLHGEPQVIWEQEEVNQMIINENLEYAVIGKFSYGWPDIQELRKLIPKQCELKGECNIGLLSNRHILIRATLLEDYVHLLSKPAFFIAHKNLSFPMRTLKWDPMFNPGRRDVDMATKNQTRPSCARVKVEVDLLQEFPKHIKIGMRLQNDEGHNEQQCYGEHPKLYPSKEKKTEKGEEKHHEEANKSHKIENKAECGNDIQQIKGKAQQQGKKEGQFAEQRYKKWGGGRRYQTEKEVQVLTPGVQTSNNKEIRNNIQILKRTAEPIKVNINSGSEHIDIPEESESVQNGDREVSVTKKGPNFVGESKKDLRHKKETEEDEDMEFNILQISKAGDLSPRHTDSLKNGARKGRPTIPLQDPSELEQYKRRLGFSHASVNSSGKIWVFWKEDWESSSVLDSIQQVTMKFTYNNKCCIISSVYARCNALDRLELWEELESIDKKDHYPWRCDFQEVNTLGGMVELKRNAFLKFKRLDLVLVNQDFMNLFPPSEVQHLIRQGSDHAPLNLICNSKEEHSIKHFRFLNFWIRHHQFKDIVTQNWKIDFAGSPFVEFPAKIKKVKKALARWSREVFGNVFQRIATIEDVIKVKKSQLKIQPTANNRAELNKLEAELKNFLKHEEEFWKQKAGMKWFKEGDANTKFFHSYVTGRKKKLHIAEISNEQIGKATVDFFVAQFTEDNGNSDYNMLDYIPRSISNAENEDMIRPPEKEEVKRVVFELDGNSACGPDGFSGLFFQTCWDIIGDDITKLVRAFFCGQELPKYITHTNLVLLLKKEVVKHFSDLRPISLSSFMKKIISRLVHERILNVLPRIISQNQAGFVTGRNITENVLLA